MSNSVFVTSALWYADTWLFTLPVTAAPLDCITVVPSLSFVWRLEARHGAVSERVAARWMVPSKRKGPGRSQKLLSGREQLRPAFLPATPPTTNARLCDGNADRRFSDVALGVIGLGVRRVRSLRLPAEGIR